MTKFYMYDWGSHKNTLFKAREIVEQYLAEPDKEKARVQLISNIQVAMKAAYDQGLSRGRQE